MPSSIYDGTERVLALARVRRIDLCFDCTPASAILGDDIGVGERGADWHLREVPSLDAE